MYRPRIPQGQAILVFFLATFLAGNSGALGILQPGCHARPFVFKKRGKKEYHKAAVKVEDLIVGLYFWHVFLLKRYLRARVKACYVTEMSRRDEQALNVHSVSDTDARMETSGWAVAVRVLGPMSGHEVVGILCSSWHSCFPPFSGCFFMFLHDSACLFSRAVVFGPGPGQTYVLQIRA